MIEAPNTRKQESIPGGLEVVPLPEDFWEIADRISRPFARTEPDSQGKKIEARVVDGFEDILNEPLGAGFFYNTPTSRLQLVFALSVSQHSLVRELLKSKEAAPSDIVKVLRENRVLSGLKIIDLGCGKPYFALAAHALGAKVYTTDVAGLDHRYKGSIERHIVLNLNQPNAVEILYDGTGGNFDIVSENIIGGTPDTRRDVKTPKPERIIEIGSALLKKGGYLYYSESLDFNDKVLKKK